VAQRLVLLAHGATSGTREMIFGDRTELLDAGAVQPTGERVVSWGSSPEPACAATARALGGEPVVLDGLRGLDTGRWTGLSLSQVGEAEPAALSSWLTDPIAAPHGGESLAQLVARVGSCCDAHPWSEGRNLVVVTPLVARALATHALGVGAAAIFRIDLAPLGRVGLSRSGGPWRLQQLG
jgi:broad specificity phosphatase PhoE